MSFIKIENLTKNFGNITAVNAVSLSIEKGELYGLLGPNGAGKSTLISIVCGLMKSDNGIVTINGYNLKRDSTKIKKIIGLVPQEIALYPTLTARENLDFWGKMYGLKGNTLKKRINEVLDIAGLTNRSKDKIEKYSGGMKRRINIAAALMHHPDIIIMDEPTVGIDPQSRNYILETVLNLNKKGKTVIYTSHYIEEVEFLCSKVAIMDHGKIIANDTKDKLKKMINNIKTINVNLNNVTNDLVQKIKEIAGIKSVNNDTSNIKILAHNTEDIITNIINIINKSNKKIKSINIEEPNLENVFLSLTGRTLRD